MKALKKFSISVASLSLTACFSSFQPPAETMNSENHIVGGHSLSEAEALPVYAHSVVGLYDAKYGDLCTGTLVAKNVIVTAAHCIDNESNDLYVFFGQKLDQTTIFAKVDRYEISPYFKGASIDDLEGGDIALVHYSGLPPAGFEPAEMVTADLYSQIKKGTSSVVAGFGVSDTTNQEGSFQLREAQVLVTDPTYNNSEITVDQSQTQQGVCHGDSGGPAFIKVQGKYYLWGVTSRSLNDVSQSCLGTVIFTSTWAHRYWLERTIQKMSRPLINFEGRF